MFPTSIIIATLDRPAPLALVLRCLAAQTCPPLELIVAAAGDAAATERVVAAAHLPFPWRVLACAEKSSARQRNAAAALARGDIVAFLDDDIEFGPELLAETLPHFAASTTGAVSPRIANSDRPAPGRFTRAYYRLQAGYAHPDFGAKLFGCGINCFPVFAPAQTTPIRADWLPSTCLFVRADLFRAERFPDFTGYSFAEDVHLTARLARRSHLYFLATPELLHHSAPSEFKANLAALTAGKLHNMAVVARDVQGLTGWALAWRWQAHRLFLTLSLLARRPARWPDELRGVWRARR
jgi:glycosyltransferase involved in cell wall biosynthesis